MTGTLEHSDASRAARVFRVAHHKGIHIRGNDAHRVGHGFAFFRQRGVPAVVKANHRATQTLHGGFKRQPGAGRRFKKAAGHHFVLEQISAWRALELFGQWQSRFPGRAGSGRQWKSHVAGTGDCSFRDPWINGWRKTAAAVAGRLRGEKKPLLQEGRSGSGTAHGRQITLGNTHGAGSGRLIGHYTLAGDSYAPRHRTPRTEKKGPPGGLPHPPARGSL